MSKSQATLSNDALLERSLELRHLGQRISQRKSLLLFGEQGVGKTRLFQQIAASNKDVLYIAKGHAPREFLLALIGTLDQTRVARVPRSRDLQSMSILSLKGVAQRGLETGNSVLMIDHVQSPTMALGHLIKELNYYGRTPVVFAARSQHMEDIGSLRSLCSDKSERLELKNWPEAVALEFAHRRASETKLVASNLESFLKEMVELNHGNPGAIVQMIEMAKQPGYRLDDQIKVHILYLDFRMKGAPGGTISKAAI
jgi:Archaeal ATPase.